MEKQLLREQEICPSEEVLKNALGSNYSAFEIFRETITEPFGLTLEWNYYKDGKSWLSKICNKKKTIFWLSVWDTFFQIGFFFTEKHLEGIAALDIAEKIKEDFLKTKSVGKFLPMIFRINSEDQLADLFKVVEFKKMFK